MMSAALAGLRPTYGELAVLAAAGDRAAGRLDNRVPESAFVGVDGAVVERMTFLSNRTKVGQERFVRFVEIGEVDALVTDGGIEEEAARELEAAGSEVVRA